MNLAGKRVLIVGATSDVGRACAEEFVARGGRVALLARRTEDLTSLANELGKSRETYTADVTDSEALKASFRDMLADGPLDGMLYAVGLHRFAPLRILSEQQVAESFQLNVGSFLQCVRHFAKAPSDTPRAVVGISSIAHRAAEPGLIAYSSAKAALVAGIRGAAAELASSGIRVNAISPGWLEGRTATRVTGTIGADAADAIERRYPLGLGKPVDVARAAAFLLSDEARWITGVDLTVDGGRSLV